MPPSPPHEPSSRLAAALPAVTLLLAAALAAPARGAGVEDIPEGVFPPEVVRVVEAGAPLRSEPGFLFRVLRELPLGEQVVVDRRQGRWLHVRPEGWLLIDDPGPAVAESTTTELEILREGARVRGGPSTEEPILRSLGLGQHVEAFGREGDWWRLVEGGFLFHSLAKATGASEEAGDSGVFREPDAAPPERASTRRWSFMDVSGTLFEIAEIDETTPFVPMLRQAMRDSGVLEDDWAFLRLGISVPPGPLRFRFSPKSNAVSVVDVDGKRYGNVYVEGPLERIPAHLRGFFQAQDVVGGQRFVGILLFRPTMDPSRIREVSMWIGGAARTFYESP